MPKSHSKDSFGPPVSRVKCYACDRFYDELTTVYMLSLEGRGDDLLCIECDPEAEHALYSLSLKKDAESQ